MDAAFQGGCGLRRRLLASVSRGKVACTLLSVGSFQQAHGVRDIVSAQAWACAFVLGHSVKLYFEDFFSLCRSMQSAPGALLWRRGWLHVQAPTKRNTVKQWGTVTQSRSTQYYKVARRRTPPSRAALAGQRVHKPLVVHKPYTNRKVPLEALPDPDDNVTVHSTNAVKRTSFTSHAA